jgi:hypothetical protein
MENYTEAKFLVPDWGNMVSSGIGLSHRPASQSIMELIVISIERPSLKSMPPVPLPIRTLQNSTPPRTVVGNYEHTVQVRYANGMRKTRWVAASSYGATRDTSAQFPTAQEVSLPSSKADRRVGSALQGDCPFHFNRIHEHTHTCLYTFMKYLVYSRIGTSVCSF